ncbi:hypothetical protein MLD38_004951 [Melastoma candidum]|uniref:Uncharacterized protein n=1 Tax=Melastoma candidum TaxID=119954 RepID=A0ACB9S8N0_9MYRT|nr:hypothetical protein MLD38_004951 [Melastoma candidum]
MKEEGDFGVDVFSQDMGHWKSQDLSGTWTAETHPVIGSPVETSTTTKVDFALALQASSSSKRSRGCSNPNVMPLNLNSASGNDNVADDSTVRGVVEGNPKGREFQSSMLDVTDWRNSTTSMKGTLCYVAPEYGGSGYMLEKADFYSLGVLVLVIVSGRRPLHVLASPMKLEKADLISWCRHLAQAGDVLELVDERLNGEYSKEQATLCINQALICLQKLPELRPDIGEIVKILRGEMDLPHFQLSSRLQHHPDIWKIKKEADKEYRMRPLDPT